MSTREKAEDAFGFGAVSTSAKERIKQIRPTTPAVDVHDMSRVDEVAENAGFVSREAVEAPPYRYGNARAQRPEPRIPLNMRVPVSLGAAFQRFCEENRYSYPEALAEVMLRAGLPTK